MCGICVAVCSTSCSVRRSQFATSPLPSSGRMHWRAVRIVRDTLTGAAAAISGNSLPTVVSRKILSFQCSCTRDSAPPAAAIMSTFGGSSSKSAATRAAISSASARVSATQTAIGSPTKRTLSFANAGCSDTLKPGRPQAARIGLTPSATKSFQVKTLSRTSSGMSKPRMRAWATGLRTKASSRMPTSAISATKRPRPRRRRSSSLRRTLAPTPVPCMTSPVVPIPSEGDRYANSAPAAWEVKAQSKRGVFEPIGWTGGCTIFSILAMDFTGDGRVPGTTA